MDQQKVRQFLGARGGCPGARLLRAGLLGASWPYAGAMRLRRWGYRRKLLPSRAAAAPVISVGNLTVGGTGKTPMVAWVVGRLRQAGRTPAVLIRGYRSQRMADGGGGGPPLSDEAELLRRLTGAPVHVGADRVAAAGDAVAAGADVLVLDDGFQHRRLRRDLDIVLIDAGEPFGFGLCLPRGLLREGLSALRDADAVVVTHCDEVDGGELRALRGRLRRLAPAATFHAAAHRAAGLIDEAGRRRDPAELRGRRVYGFCGLAAPQHFRATVERGLGAELCGLRALDDHAACTPALLADIAADARRGGAELLVTTQKDHVKLDSAAAAAGLPIWQVAVEIELVEGGEQLVRRIRQAAGGDR